MVVVTAVTATTTLVPAAAGYGLRQRVAPRRAFSSAKRNLFVRPSVRLFSEVLVCFEHDAIDLTPAVFAAEVGAAPLTRVCPIAPVIVGRRNGSSVSVQQAVRGVRV